MAESSSHSSHCLNFLLSSAERDFLVRSNGLEVKISELSGKTIGLLFSSSRHDQRSWLETKLVKVYNELCSNKNDFEVVFVPACDDDEQSLAAYFSEMPWLAIPFSDSETYRRLNQLFDVDEMPKLLILDGNGKVLAGEGVRIITEYGAEGYPFTQERIHRLGDEDLDEKQEDQEDDEEDQEEKAKEEQTLRTLLVADSRDFLISNDGNQVPVSDLQGKMVGLYFTAFEYYPTPEFTQQLVEFYVKLKENGERFEMVLVSLDDDEDFFKEGLEGMPWLALPFDDERCIELAAHFDVSTFPALVILDQDGKTVHSNAAKFVEEHGIKAYPFTPEKFAELDEIESARRQSQTLSSLLVSEDRDYLLRKDGSKVPVSELEGKVVGLYFSTSVFYPCIEFSEKLGEVYDELKKNENGNDHNETSDNSLAFEVVLISLDDCEGSFKQSLEGMPGQLALPFNDKISCNKLARYFDLSALPTLVIIAQNGKTLHSNAAGLVQEFGVQAYPFTPEKLAQLRGGREHISFRDPHALEPVSSNLWDRDFVIEKFGSEVRVLFFDD